MTEPVPCGHQPRVLDLAPVVLWRRPAEVALRRDGRDHDFHLRSDGLVGREIVVFHQNLWVLVAGHVGVDLGLALALLGVQVDVAAGDVNAQLVPLPLLGLRSGSLLVVDAGGRRVVVAAGFGRQAGSVAVLRVLVH